MDAAPEAAAWQRFTNEAPAHTSSWCAVFDAQERSILVQNERKDENVCGECCGGEVRVADRLEWAANVTRFVLNCVVRVCHKATGLNNLSGRPSTATGLNNLLCCVENNFDDGRPLIGVQIVDSCVDLRRLVSSACYATSSQCVHWLHVHQECGSNGKGDMVKSRAATQAADVDCWACSSHALDC